MKPRIITFSFALLFAAITMQAYLGARSYPPSTATIGITNSYVVSDAFPKQVSEYVLSRLNRYIANNDLQTDDYVIKPNSITTTDDGYTFIVENKKQLASNGSGEEDDTPNDNALTVDLQIANYGNFFSIKVTINGQEQDIS